MNGAGGVGGATKRGGKGDGKGGCGRGRRWQDQGEGEQGRRAPPAHANGGDGDRGGAGARRVGGGVRHATAPCTAPRFRQMKARTRPNVSRSRPRAGGGVRPRLPPASAQRACRQRRAARTQRLPIRPGGGVPRWRGRQAGGSPAKRPTPPREGASRARDGSPATASPALGAKPRQDDPGWQPAASRLANKTITMSPRTARATRWGSTGLPARERSAARTAWESLADCVVVGGFTQASLVVPLQIVTDDPSVCGAPADQSGDAIGEWVPA